MIANRKISVQAATALLAAVTLICGFGGAITSAAAAADPSYSWATKGGGPGADYAQGVSALPDGSSIITGAFNGTATFGATSLTSTGSYDTFTAKVYADGSYAWATKGGGLSNDFARGVSALTNGSSIITGFFNGTATFGATRLTSDGGSNDAFTAKVNADGSYAWATKGGGPGSDVGVDVSALSDGSSIITGFFAGTATFGATILISSAGLDDTFTAKVNADGTYAWATKGGGSGFAAARGISALSDGSSIITGSFSGTETFGATSLTSTGSNDAFTAKVNADGSYAWATKGGGPGADYAQGVSALPDGSGIITGSFRGTATFGTTPPLISTGLSDAFTAKVNANGSYAWATKGGGIFDDAAQGVSALPDGSSIITGQFRGTATFGTTPPLISTGLYDSFTAKVNADGSYAWAIKAGGTLNDAAQGVSALPDGSSIITGEFRGTATFGTTPSLISDAGSDDIFTARILAEAPQAPTGASASAGIREATITWNAVAGGSVSSYTATAAPGGASCTAVAPAITCTITNLTAGISYTITVTATNPQGTSPPSLASNAVTAKFTELPSNKFKVRSVKVGVKALKSTVVVPGRGTLTQRVTRKRSAKSAAVLIVCKTSRKATKAGTVKLTCKLSSATRAALRKRSLRVSMKTTFTPTGGLTASKTKLIKLKRRQ